MTAHTPSRTTLCTDEIAAIQRMRAAVGMRETARRVGVSADTLYRAVAGLALYRASATQIRLGLLLAAQTAPSNEGAAVRS